MLAGGAGPHTPSVSSVATLEPPAPGPPVPSPRRAPPTTREGHWGPGGGRGTHTAGHRGPGRRPPHQVGSWPALLPESVQEGFRAAALAGGCPSVDAPLLCFISSSNEPRTCFY